MTAAPRVRKEGATKVIHHPYVFIGGQWVRTHATDAITVASANTEETIGSVPDPDPVDVDTAVGAARAAFDHPSGWRHWEPAARAEALRRFADSLDKRSEEIALRVSDQNGMPITAARAGDSRMPGRVLRYYADLIGDETGEESRASSTGGQTLVRRVPLGVVAGVVPWNYPNILSAMKYAPALAAGCTIVLKPSPETVLDAVLVGDAAVEAGLPPGVLNILPGGGETGARLVAHPGVDMVTLTGSTAAGRQVGEVCGRLLRPVTLELGGKSAAVILDDADLDLHSVGAQLTPALFGNNGQTCFLSSRVLAPRSRYREVVDTVAELARSLTVGNSLDPATQVGPLVSRRQRDRVEGYIAQGRAEGARLVIGGGRPADQKTGWFVEPTVFADVDNSSTIAREEIFGPVVTITPYTDDEDAVRIANDSEYGLGGTVWTTDAERGLTIARRIESGTIGLNGYQPDLRSPMSAIKASGLGVKLGPEGLRSYQGLRSIYR
jgi:acyl-CoA reductase-like NAD-dependent aldehyde dehydrogenase